MSTPLYSTRPHSPPHSASPWSSREHAPPREEGEEVDDAEERRTGGGGEEKKRWRRGGGEEERRRGGGGREGMMKSTLDDSSRAPSLDLLHRIPFKFTSPSPSTVIKIIRYYMIYYIWSNRIGSAGRRTRGTGGPKEHVTID